MLTAIAARVKFVLNTFKKNLNTVLEFFSSIFQKLLCYDLVEFEELSILGQVLVVICSNFFLFQVLMPLVGKMRQSGLMWSKNAESLSRFEILSAWGKFREKQGQHAGSYSVQNLFSLDC